MNTNRNKGTETKVDTSHYDKCRTMMMKHKKNHMLRVNLVMFLMLINAYVGVIRAPIIHGAAYLYGVFLGVGILIYCVITTLIGWFATAEKPKLLAVTCILLLIGILSEWLVPYLGIPMLLLFLWQIPETKQATWIRQQEGYPHFNERFTEQMGKFGKEYQPEYGFDSDNSHDAEMPDMPEMPSPDFVVKEMPDMPDIPELLSSDLTATEQTAIPEMMQDIPEISQMQNNDLGTDRILMKH